MSIPWIKLLLMSSKIKKMHYIFHKESVYSTPLTSHRLFWTSCAAEIKTCQLYANANLLLFGLPLIVIVISTERCWFGPQYSMVWSFWQATSWKLECWISGSGNVLTFDLLPKYHSVIILIHQSIQGLSIQNYVRSTKDDK